jgi:hypothetical protein
MASVNAEPPADDSQSSDTPADQGPSGKSWSLRDWWAGQKAASRRDWQKFREWWRKKTTVEPDPSHPPEPNEQPKQRVAVEPEKSTSSKVETTARLAVWAPTAVVLAVVGALLTAAILLSFYYSLRSDDSVGIYRVVAAISTTAVFGLLMFWFAATPNAPTTSKRFWFLLRTQIIILGALALVGIIVIGLMMMGFIDKFDSNTSLVPTNIIQFFGRR